MYQRFVEQQIKDALADTPVVLLTGPRRVGKTTLVRSLKDSNRTYITLDDPATFNLAHSDPVNFIRSLNVATIDEVQRVPELLLVIKQVVDEDYRPGRFLLTGSANVMLLPRVADSLAGRIEVIRMLPLTQAEINGVAPTFVERSFNRDPKFNITAVAGDELLRLVLQGGYPEAIARSSERRRSDWVRSYLSSILSRDLPDIGVVEQLTELPKLVEILAEHSGQLINYSRLGTSIGVNYKTCQRYLALLELLYLVAAVRPWYTNTLKRIVKTPKVHLLDPCLLATYRQLKFNHVKANQDSLGALFECFVYSEILKLVTAAEEDYRIYHFRDQSMREVDIVIERSDRMIVGIEVKSSATVNSRNFSGLRSLATACKDQFAYGMVLYNGYNTVPFGKNMAAVPISNLWA